MKPTAERIVQLLAGAGLVADPADLRPERRDDRWLVRLAGEIVVWVPAKAAGAQALRAERDVLRLVAAQCGFQVPRVLYADDDGGDVRSVVPGVSDPPWFSQLLKQDTQLAQRVGRALGRILAEQHSSVMEAEVPATVQRRVSWPMPLAWMRRRLPRVVTDAGLLARVERVLEAYAAQPTDPADRVLVHGDFGFHNMAVEPTTGEVAGVFDYGDAAWDDRHHDFRYLEYEVGRTEVLDAAISVYEAATGVRIDRRRVRLLQAVSAICFLANRDGVAPEAVWCGRTLAQDLDWVEAVIAGVV